LARVALLLLGFGIDGTPKLLLVAIGAFYPGYPQLLEGSAPTVDTAPRW
jgi:ABC-type nitrate/sulfonate/bicarbonate transport system permease component